MSASPASNSYLHPLSACPSHRPRPRTSSSRLAVRLTRLALPRVVHTGPTLRGQPSTATSHAPKQLSTSRLVVRLARLGIQRALRAGSTRRERPSASASYALGQHPASRLAVCLNLSPPHPIWLSVSSDSATHAQCTPARRSKGDHPPPPPVWRSVSPASTSHLRLPPGCPPRQTRPPARSACWSDAARATIFLHLSCA